MKNILGLLLGTLLCAGAAADDSDIRCFVSNGPGKPIRLQLTFPKEGGGHGTVRYQRGSAAIPIKAVDEITLEAVPGRPWTFQTDWQEMLAGGGTYVVVSHGTRIYEFRYIKANGKTFAFREEPEAVAEHGCRWPDK